MARAGNEEDVPYISFNKNITDSDALGPPPNDEDLDQMRKMDPQLDAAWVLWESVSQKDAKADWANATKEVCTIRSVKEFWGVWNHLPQPSALLEGKKFMRDDGTKQQELQSFMLFKKGVRPEWEDKANANGGHFQLNLKRQLGGGTIDEIWNNTVIGCLSGWIQPTDTITGVRLTDQLQKKGSIGVQVWFSCEVLASADEGDTLYKLRGSFEERLRTRIDGTSIKANWDFTQVVSHRESDNTTTKENGRKK